MDAFQFADLCRTMLNIDRDELENAGVLTPGKTDDGGTSWKRWNDNPWVFVLKLDDERLQRLWVLLGARNPKAMQYRPDGLPAVGTPIAIEHDGFSGRVIGYYETLEGKRGVNLQLDGARVVHVYGEKWLKP